MISVFLHQKMYLSPIIDGCLPQLFLTYGIAFEPEITNLIQCRIYAIETTTDKGYSLPNSRPDFFCAGGY
jgi:hypothetical protein